MRKLDLTDQRFGRLIAREDVGRAGRMVLWKCICDCGQEVIVRLGSLRSGRTKSCGCLGRELTSERFTLHGLSRTKLYKQEKQKSYYQDNRERLSREALERMRLRPIEQRRSDKAQWDKANAEHVARSNAKWCRDNPDKKSANDKRSRAKRRDQINARRRVRFQQNKSRFYAYAAKRKTEICESFNQGIVSALFDQAKRLTQCLGLLFHVDHIVPLARGGTSHQSNLQVMPALLNLKKRDKVLNNPIWALAK